MYKYFADHSSKAKKRFSSTITSVQKVPHIQFFPMSKISAKSFDINVVVKSRTKHFFAANLDILSLKHQLNYTLLKVINEQAHEIMVLIT